MFIRKNALFFGSAELPLADRGSADRRIKILFIR